ncbi:hypothetical protein BJ965_007699 [Streptomyces luteogriseus]|uniref:Uncharacterized protein n=1 Tax=Streptomyces luteogriseus TaxID=68233 RepID=A0A7W7DW72_9ACTN|nr:hypothetical protein [Streptomyces luteogriseus]
MGPVDDQDLHAYAHAVSIRTGWPPAWRCLEQRRSATCLVPSHVGLTSALGRCPCLFGQGRGPGWRHGDLVPYLLRGRRSVAVF